MNRERKLRSERQVIKDGSVQRERADSLMDPAPSSSAPQTESVPSHFPVFLRKAKGMPFEEFKKLFIGQLKEAGLIKSNPQPNTSKLVTTVSVRDKCLHDTDT